MKKRFRRMIIKQRIVGLLLILLSVLMVKLTGGEDAGGVLLFMPLGLYLFITKNLIING